MSWNGGRAPIWSMHWPLIFTDPLWAAACLIAAWHAVCPYCISCWGIGGWCDSRKWFSCTVSSWSPHFPHCPKLALALHSGWCCKPCQTITTVSLLSLKIGTLWWPQWFSILRISSHTSMSMEMLLLLFYMLWGRRALAGMEANLLCESCLLKLAWLNAKEFLRPSCSFSGQEES